jgi:hypothetical protein
MKLDNNPFPVNMNMVELDGKKTLVRLSQVEMTMGMEVTIGEEWPPRMIKPRSLGRAPSLSRASLLLT